MWTHAFIYIYNCIDSILCGYAYLFFGGVAVNNLHPLAITAVVSSILTCYFIFVVG